MASVFHLPGSDPASRPRPRKPTPQAALDPASRTPQADEELLARIRAQALRALRERDAQFLVRTAGVQSCARLGLTEALPEIRGIAGDDGTKPTHVRVVAVAALGDLGDEADLPLLGRLASSARGQLKAAAALALKKVRARTAAGPVEHDATDAPEPLPVPSEERRGRASF